MRLRTKFLLLLLGIALVPLIASVAFQGHLMRTLADRLTERARTAMTERRTIDLEQTAALAAATLRRERELIETALHLMHTETLRTLAGRPAASAEDRVLPVARFDAGDVPGLGQGVQGEGVPVSLRVASLHVPQDARPTQGPDLAPMVPVLRDLHRRYGDLVQWLHLTAADGRHLTFPGHGAYPPGYDARERVWYERAEVRNGPAWAGPYIDASSRGLLMTLARRVDDGGGRTAAVVAIDVPILKILARVRDRLELPGGSEAYLVDTAPRPDGRTGVRILAHRDYETGDWRGDIRLGWMEGPDGGRFAELRDDLAMGAPGIQRLAFQGDDSLWAYAPVRGLDTFLLLVVPLTDLEQETRRARGMVDAEIRFVGRWAALLAFAFIALTVLAALFGAQTITVPVRTLARAAERLAAGDFSVRAEVAAGGEVGDLARTFNAMVPKLADHLRLRRDVGLAEQVQHSLLPRSAPSLPGLSLAGLSRYCDETGGDYYDFMGPDELGPGRVAATLGDVSGHGIPAALLMTTTRALLRAQASAAQGPAALVTAVNRHLSRDAGGGRFVTLFHMEAMSVPGRPPELTWCVAGHGGALLYDPAADRFEELGGDGIPLGILAEAVYADSGPRPLPPGGVVVVGTDGIWEAEDPGGRVFGMQRIKEIVRGNREEDAERIAQAVLGAVARFRGPAPPLDDATLIVAKGTSIDG